MPRSARSSSAGAPAVPARRVAGAPARRAPRRALALLAAALAGGAATASAGTVEGQAFDRTGRPLPNVTIALVERTGGGMLSRSPATDTVVMRTQTDGAGFFLFDTGPRDVRGRVLVRCAGDPGWDGLRYAAPADVDVTRGLRDRGRAVVSCVAEDAPGWPALAAEIERAGGPDSDRGRVLRRHGLPPQTVTAADGSVEWQYPGGLVFAFKDGALVRGPAPGDATPPAPPAGEPSR